jgi:hypothetical protein
VFDGRIANPGECEMSYLSTKLNSMLVISFLMECGYYVIGQRQVFGYAELQAYYYNRVAPPPAAEFVFLTDASFLNMVHKLNRREHHYQAGLALLTDLIHFPGRPDLQGKERGEFVDTSIANRRVTILTPATAEALACEWRERPPAYLTPSLRVLLSYLTAYVRRSGHPLAIELLGRKPLAELRDLRVASVRRYFVAERHRWQGSRGT